jgi:hypothetical protein
MKSIVSVALIGGVISVAAALLPGDAGQAWGPFAALSTGVLLMSYWAVERDHTPASDRTATHKHAA